MLEKLPKLKRKQTWVHIKEVALYKANYKCTKCSNDKKLEVHHLVYPAIKLDDALVLCRGCHQEVHRKSTDKTVRNDIYLSVYIPERDLHLVGALNRMAERIGMNRNQFIVKLLKNFAQLLGDLD